MSAQIIRHPSTPEAMTRQGYRVLIKRMREHSEMLNRAYDNQNDTIHCKPPTKETSNG